jgi:hypothetical protein
MENDVVEKKEGALKKITADRSTKPESSHLGTHGESGRGKVGYYCG